MFSMIACVCVRVKRSKTCHHGVTLAGVQLQKRLGGVIAIFSSDGEGVTFWVLAARFVANYCEKWAKVRASEGKSEGKRFCYHVGVFCNWSNGVKEVAGPGGLEKFGRDSLYAGIAVLAG
jgi:hypothetical protein